MSLDVLLRNKIRAAGQREMDDDHLSEEQRSALVREIRIAENISDEVSDEQIYEEYVID